MSKKLKTILLGLSLLAISLVLIIVFFVVKKPSNKPLTISASQVNLNKGEVIYNFYTISHKEASISFETDTENIVEISADFIKGLKAGVTNITIKAKLGNEETQTTFKVCVYESSYSYAILPQSNCTIADNTLTTNGNCQFKINIYDNLGQIVKNPAFTYTTTNNASLIYEFNVFQLSANEDCTINIVCQALELEISITVLIK